MKTAFLLLLCALVIETWGCKQKDQQTEFGDSKISLASAEPRPAPAVDSHTNRVYTVQFAPDGRRLNTSSEDGAIRLWDVQTGQELNPSEKDGSLPPPPAVSDNSDNLKHLEDRMEAVEKRLGELEKAKEQQAK